MEFVVVVVDVCVYICRQIIPIRMRCISIVALVALENGGRKNARQYPVNCHLSRFRFSAKNHTHRSLGRSRAPTQQFTK